MKWFRAEASNDNAANIWINGQIGEDWWSGNGNTAQGFIDEVEALGDVNVINLHINSPGGDVADGLAIFNYLRNHPAKITAVIESQAASIASVIAMAGDEVVMGVGATMMVHNPWTWASGNADKFRKIADDLDVVAKGLVDAYAFKSGKSADEIQALLDAETYMAAGQAIELGFADREDIELKAVASADMGAIKAHAQMSSKVMMQAREIDDLELKISELEAQQVPPPSADAKDIISICASKKLDTLALGLVESGATLEQVRSKLEVASSIQTVCAAANIDSSPAIAKMDDTQELLGYVIHEALAQHEPEQDTHLSPGAGTSQAKAPSAQAVYSQLNNS